MRRIQQSVCYPIFQDKRPLDAYFGEVAEIGFAAVELWGFDESLPQIVETARRQGLAVASVTGHESIDHGLNDPAHHERIVKELRHTVDVCSDLGIPGCIVFSGSRRAGVSDAQGLVYAAQGLRLIAPYAEAKGVNLNLELLNSRVDHYDYMGDTTDWIIALCEMVGSPRVKMLYDIYHAQIMEGDIIRNLRKAAAHLGHIHTAGNPGRNGLGDDQELNYPGIMKALADLGYTGYVGHEFMPNGPDPIAQLRQAFALCDV